MRRVSGGRRSQAVAVLRSMVDASRVNNAMRTEESSKVGWLAGARTLFLVQQLLSGLGL